MIGRSSSRDNGPKGDKFGPLGSGDRHVLGQIHILDRVQERHAILHRLLERLPAGNEAHAARALLDDGGLHRIGQIVVARGAAPSSPAKRSGAMEIVEGPDAVVRRLMRPKRLPL